MPHGGWSFAYLGIWRRNSNECNLIVSPKPTMLPLKWSERAIPIVSGSIVFEVSLISGFEFLTHLFLNWEQNYLKKGNK